MLRHPARRAHILALIGAGVLIVTFGGIGIELGNDMARHGDMDRQSTAAGSYLRGVHHATSDARICHYAFEAEHNPVDGECYQQAVTQLADARAGFDGFRSVQLREGGGRKEALRWVGAGADTITTGAEASDA